MIDPASVVGGLASGFQLLDYLKERRREFRTISAIFDADCTRLEGAEALQVDRIPVQDNARMWYYRVRQTAGGYVYVPMPLVPTLFIDYGTPNGEQTPSVEFFRFVASPMAQYASGGEPNVRVGFIVAAYDPRALLQAREET